MSSITTIVKLAITATSALYTALYAIPVRIKTFCPQGLISVVPKDDDISLLKITRANESLPTLLQKHGAVAGEASGHPDRPVRAPIRPKPQPGGFGSFHDLSKGARKMNPSAGL